MGKPWRMERHKDEAASGVIHHERRWEDQRKSFQAGVPPPHDKHSSGSGQRSPFFNTPNPPKYPLLPEREEPNRRRPKVLICFKICKEERGDVNRLLHYLSRCKVSYQQPARFISPLDIQMRAELKYLPRNKRSSSTFDFKIKPDSIFFFFFYFHVWLNTAGLLFSFFVRKTPKAQFVWGDQFLLWVLERKPEVMIVQFLNVNIFV